MVVATYMCKRKGGKEPKRANGPLGGVHDHRYVHNAPAFLIFIMIIAVSVGILTVHTARSTQTRSTLNSAVLQHAMCQVFKQGTWNQGKNKTARSARQQWLSLQDAEIFLQQYAMHGIIHQIQQRGGGGGGRERKYG